ncbi:hypothetical protein BASA81_010279 [Batrachochytrium salamandrivorans]|nr:hypothetical protein BASA81_010279 [Batrachochytrium salamandrivorans]
MLCGLGLAESSLRAAGEWSGSAGESPEAEFQRFLSTPLRAVVAQSGQISPALAGEGICKGCLVVEVELYRDIARPLPPVKEVESGNEEEPPSSSGNSSNRTLKLQVTDGANSFVALEYEPCAALDLIRLGAKLQLRDAYYMNGMLLLTPRCVQFIGAPHSLANWNLPG